jgi:hypothetical protein
MVVQYKKIRKAKIRNSYRHLVIRVPSHNFDVFYKNISKELAISKEKRLQPNVTAQFVDIDARLRKPLKIGTSRLLKKKQKGNKCSIEKQLSFIRESETRRT